MSLISPTIWAQILVHRRLIAIVAACLVGLLLLLYLFAGIDSCNFNRGQNTRKEAVNSAIEKIKSIETNINSERALANQLVEQIKVDTKEHQVAVNATDAQRANTNAAIRRMNEERNANRNVNAAELEKLLEDF